MPSFIADHPMLCALALIFIDIGVWRLISAELANWKLAARLVIFAVFSAVLFNDGMNPMQLAPYTDNTALHLAATALQIGWWLIAARTLQGLGGAAIMAIQPALVRSIYPRAALGREHQCLHHGFGAGSGLHQVQLQLHLPLGPGNAHQHLRKKLRAVDQQLETVGAAPREHCAAHVSAP